MAYCDFKETCRNAWSERFNYICIDMVKNKNEKKYHIINANRSTLIECIPETELFLKKYVLID